MADITFDCPHCHQPIQCDTQWAGQQIQCPLCQGLLAVPQGESAPAADYGKQSVTPPAGGKLAFQHNAQKPATQKRDIPIRNLAGPAAARKKSPLISLAIGAVVVVALAGGGYFGWTKFQERQEAKKAEEARQAEAAAKEAKKREQAAAQTAAGAAAPGAQAAFAAGGPTTPPVYTLDVATAKIPQCAVNGTISGSNFVAEVVRVDVVGARPVLRLTQGSNPTQPDREFLIYLTLKPGEKLSGHTWNVTSDQKGPGLPQVIKRWMVKAGFAPAMKSYTSGYALQLELGQMANGVLPGKVFIALPDQEQSVAGGVFQAATSIVEGAPVTPTPGVAPAPAPGVVPTAPSATTDRYGRRR